MQCETMSLAQHGITMSDMIRWIASDKIYMIICQYILATIQLWKNHQSIKHAPNDPHFTHPRRHWWRHFDIFVEAYIAKKHVWVFRTMANHGKCPLKKTWKTLENHGKPGFLVPNDGTDRAWNIPSSRPSGRRPHRDPPGPVARPFLVPLCPNGMRMGFGQDQLKCWVMTLWKSPAT